MEELFGISINFITILMLSLTGIVLVIIVGLSLKDRISWRLAWANIPRRKARTTLIILGLTLSSIIITTAFITGDTLSLTSRSGAITALGHIDEIVVATQGNSESAAVATIAGYGVPTFIEVSQFEQLTAVFDQEPLIDGYAPIIQYPSNLINLKSGLGEPNSTILATNHQFETSFGEFITIDDRQVTVDSLGTTAVFINETGATQLQATINDTIQFRLGANLIDATVAGIIQNEGLNSTNPTIVLPLQVAQAHLNAPEQITGIFISNRGDALNGVENSDDVIEIIHQNSDELLAIDVKTNAFERSNQIGTLFTSIFLLLSIFAIGSGLLLIVLIFVMLGTERKAEIGLVRALGMQKTHVARAFIIEGLIYDVVAALLGTVIGVGISIIVVQNLANIANSFLGDERLTEIQVQVQPQALILSFCLALLLSLLTIFMTAWRISGMNIVSAMRNLTTTTQKPRSIWRVIGSLVLALYVIGSGVTPIIFGYIGKQKSSIIVGITIIAFGLGLLLKWGMGWFALSSAKQNRITFSFVGILWLIIWLTPYAIRDRVLQVEAFANGTDLFIISGFVTILAVIILLVYNANLIQSGLNLFLNRLGKLTPILRLSIAYPLQQRFRTGMTLAMFALVSYMIVATAVLINTSGQAFSDIERSTAGFDVRGVIFGANPDQHLTAEILSEETLKSAEISAIGTVSNLTVNVRQEQTTQDWTEYFLVSYNDDYLTQANQHFRFTLRSEAYPTDEAVWQALQTRNDVAIVGGLEVPYRQQVAFAENIPGFWLEGVVQEDALLPPTYLTLQNPETEQTQTVEVIGVLDWVGDIAGAIQTNDQVLTQLTSTPPTPTMYYLQIAETADPIATARQFEQTFLSVGLNAISTEQAAINAQSGTRTISQLLQGFLAIGLVIGIVALGVVSARAVVERRKQIGVLRAIGIQSRTVLYIFLLETSIIALVGIGIGIMLALNTTWNMIRDFYGNEIGSAQFAPPWGTMLLILGVTYLVSLGMTLIPSFSASRIYPAEALRYE